jgi:uncharacterized protein YjiK
MRKLFQMECPAVSLGLLWVLLCCSACSDGSYTSPLGYELHKPAQRELGKSLNEISGLYYVRGEDALLAISDSKRNIFRIDLRTQKLTDKVKNFYEQQDFEDITQVGDVIYVLISNGDIVEVPINGADSVNVYAANLAGKNDFETLYYDPQAKGLVMLCKSCKDDKGAGLRSAYLFRLADKAFDPEPFYTISSEAVKKVARNDDADFKPSAAAINPVDGKLYILSSAGQLLVIADTRGRVEEVYRLNPDHHPQAEGIAFSPSGAMYISNEGKYGAATLKMYTYKKSARMRAAKTKG